MNNFLLISFTIFLGDQKNRLIDTVILSTHNIVFWLRNKKFISATHSYLKAWILSFAFCYCFSAFWYQIQTCMPMMQDIECQYK